jgi:DNA (cytosine-5)-methyltransferase 1
MPAYYNENDPGAVAWLRQLIREGLIADGQVDSRSIVAVRPADLSGFTQCHFFAGIGGWSYALRLANWSDDRPVWTGSCPCQPFSVAGNPWRDGLGVDDPRHLWPAWFRLIRECSPGIIFGEQVAGTAGLDWLDLVSADLENDAYEVGALDLCAAGIGAPHIRQRLYWVADAPRARRQGFAGDVDDGDQPRRERPRSAGPLWNVDLWDHVAAVVCRDGRCRPLPVADGVSDRLDAGGTSDRSITALEQRRVRLIRGYGNAIVPALAATFIRAYDEAR